MPVPFPSETNVKLTRPDAEEVAWLGRGIVTAVLPASGHTPLQDMLLKAVFESMTGFGIDPDEMCVLVFGGSQAWPAATSSSGPGSSR